MAVPAGSSLEGLLRQAHALPVVLLFLAQPDFKRAFKWAGEGRSQKHSVAVPRTLWQTGCVSKAWRWQRILGWEPFSCLCQHLSA